MLSLAFLVLFVLICAGLLTHRPWEKPSAWATAVGIASVVSGVLMEVLRFQQSKNQKQLFTLSGRGRGGTTQAGLLLMLLAAGCLTVGLALVMLQALAFFWS